MQITPNIHTIEGVHPPVSGWKFVAKSPPRTVTKFHHDRYSTYYPTVITHGSHVTLFDTGTPECLPQIESCLNSLGYGLSDVQNIVMSHCRGDHIGEVNRLVEASGAKVFAHELEVPYFERKLLYENRAYDPMKVDVAVKDGDVLDVLGGLQIVHTPGHTPGHICLYLPSQKAMLAADLIRHSGEAWHLCPPQYSMDYAMLMKSLVKVGAFDFDIMVVYHGESILSDAAAKYRENIDYLQAISDIMLPAVKDALAPEVVIEHGHV